MSPLLETFLDYLCKIATVLLHPNTSHHPHPLRCVFLHSTYGLQHGLPWALSHGTLLGSEKGLDPASSGSVRAINFDNLSQPLINV